MKNIPFVDLRSQYKNIKEEIDIAISNVIQDTAFIKGKYVENFERDYAKFYGVKNCVSCANGTDAIYISLKALGLGSGDEVITTSCSWISTSETITQAGAKVVFADIEPDYYTINVKDIEEKITKKTKAIIPVHLYGHPANMTEIMELAKKYNLYVIEDCAQAHFAEWGDKKVGTFGDVGTFSFFPGKNLGAYGDAGAIVTNNDKLAEKLRMYANHGALIKHSHKIEGINSRLDGLQAAILSVKLKYIETWTSQRIELAKYYNYKFSEFKDILAPQIHQFAKHVFHLFVIRTNNRKEIQNILQSNGINTAIHYPSPLPFLPAYSYLGHSSKDFPVASSYYDKILSLPIYPELKKESIDYIVDLLRKLK